LMFGDWIFLQKRTEMFITDVQSAIADILYNQLLKLLFSILNS
jgi:hypothetical protein